MKIFKKKKGNIFDILLIGIFMFIFAIILIMNFMILNKIEEGLDESGTINQSAMDIIQKQIRIFPNIWDKGLVFVLVGLGIFTWVSAFFVRSHPVFFIFAFFIIVIYIIVFGIISSTYGEIIDNPEISPYADSFPLTNFIMAQYPTIMAIISFITAIIMFSKGGEPRF